MGSYNYDMVRKWSSNVPGKDIFKLKYIICPVNDDNVHWSVAIIFMEETKIQWYNSMGGTDNTKLHGLLRYLQDVYKEKHGGDLDVHEWRLVYCTSDTPRQVNGK